MRLLDKLKSFAGQAKEKAEPMAEKAKEKAGPLAEKAKEKAAPVAEKAGEYAAKGVEAAATRIDKATGGKYHDKIENVSTKVEGVLDKSAKPEGEDAAKPPAAPKEDTPEGGSASS